MSVEPIRDQLEPLPDDLELLGQTVSSCRLGNETALLVPFTGPALSGPTLLLALLAEKRGSRIERYLVVDRDVDPLIRPAIMPTAVGIALIYARADGATRFFEGSIERFAPVGALPPLEEDLQAMPYADHIIFSA